VPLDAVCMWHFLCFHSKCNVQNCGIYFLVIISGWKYKTVTPLLCYMGVRVSYLTLRRKM